MNETQSHIIDLFVAWEKRRKEKKMITLNGDLHLNFCFILHLSASAYALHGNYF